MKEMRLTSYIDTEFIFTGINVSSKQEMIKEIIKRVSEKDEKFNQNRDEIEKAVFKRESELSTAMGNKVAIPHARVESYDDFIVAVGVNQKEIECETIYHKKDMIKYFFMVICSSKKNKIILKVVPAIQQMFRNKEFNEKIYEKEINTPSDILKLMEKFDKDSSDGLEAEDVMRTDIKPASLDDTLEQIAIRLVEEDINGLAVVDEKGDFTGDITEEELIMFGLPKYAFFMKDLNFVRNSEQFEEYFKNEKYVKIRDIHEVFPITTVTRNTSVVELSFLMIHNKVSRIYVVENKKYYGTIFRNDIIKKVIHI
jgi:nitrogen PTS system EIIA component